MIYAVVVVYNKSCNDSNSIRGIRKYAPKIPIIVYDNSTEDYGNEKYCIANNYIYLTQHANVGISKAYNYVIDNVKLMDDDYVVMLDDDTHLNAEYFNEVFNKSKVTNLDVMLPIVVANNKIISPYNYYKKTRTKMIESANDIDMKKVSGINSGMAIRAAMLKKSRYNEALFLDYVDYDFMKRVHQKNGNIYIMNSVIKQEFQYFNYDKRNIKSALFRFQIDLRDYKQLCKENNERYFFYLHAIKFMIKQTINYKSTRFLGLLLKELIK